MKSAFRGILEGSRIRWIGTGPPDGEPHEVEVRVVPSATDTAERRKRLADLLDEIASHGGLKSFGDPMEWQHEVRKDRQLAGAGCSNHFQESVRIISQNQIRARALDRL